MKYWIMFVLLILLTACSEGGFDFSEADVDKVIVCDSPYIRHASGCCLDKNDNKICDEDESNADIVLYEEPCDGTWIKVEWKNGETFSSVQELKEAALRDFPKEESEKMLEGIDKSNFRLNKGILESCSEVHTITPNKR